LEYYRSEQLVFGYLSFTLDLPTKTIYSLIEMYCLYHLFAKKAIKIQKLPLESVRGCSI